MFDETQADAHAFGLASQLGFNAIETLKDVLVILGGNAIALILNLDAGSAMRSV